LRKDFPLITIILRGYNFQQIKTVAEVLSKSDEEYAVEITMNTDTAVDDIEKIKKEFPSMKIGAGTVTTLKQAKNSVRAGAEFLLSPIAFENSILDLCKKKGVLSVPAGFTPTEIKKLFRKGADIVKVFPATTVGPKYFKDIQAPLGNLPLMAVGGINEKNAKDFLDNGATYLGIGSGLFEKHDIQNEEIENLTRSLKKFEKSIL